MNEKIDNKQPKNYVELSEHQILERAKEEISPIQQNLIDKKITIDEAKNELNKINEWLQSSILEESEKVEIGGTFERLNNLEKNMEEKTLNDEVENIKKLLEELTKKELNKLKHDVNFSSFNLIPSLDTRPLEVQNNINNSAKRMESTIKLAKKDKNKIASKIGLWMEKLLS